MTLKTEIYSILKQYWGYDSFRSGQEEIIRNVCENKDTLAMMATGSGKTICYQIPGLYKKGLTLVVSPLIALMTDQINDLRKRGIKCEMVNGNQSLREQDILLDNVAYSDTKFLFVSPERLINKMLLSRLDKLNIELLAVDEAHCISEWGHDFRPEYRNIASFRERLNQVPVIALTATANPKAFDDISNNLKLKSPYIVKQAPTRNNLQYDVVYHENKKAFLSSALMNTKGSGIIYVNKRKTAVEISRYLNKQSFDTSAYHGAMDHKQRLEILNNWVAGKQKFVVATKAFGMGIDKSDVRNVFHFDLPDALESYVQEAGRAGRDGQLARATILYNNSDIKEKEKLLADIFPDVAFIRSVYKYLSVHLDVASGLHEAQDYALDLKKFYKTFQLPAFRTFNTLVLLSKSGYLTLSESMIHPSRLLLDELKINQLNTDKKIDKRLHTLIRVLLRNYEGLFISPTRIDESQIAKKMGMKSPQIQKALLWLHNHAFAKYQANFDGHFVTFPEYRFRGNEIQLTPGIYEHQIQRYKENLQIFDNYLQSNSCRQAIINEYFGFKSEQKCGICDNCKKGNSDLSKKEITDRIVDFLSERSRNLEEFMSLFESYEHPAVKQRLNSLYSEERITIDNDMISINKR